MEHSLHKAGLMAGECGRKVTIVIDCRGLGIGSIKLNRIAGEHPLPHQVQICLARQCR